MNQNLQLQILVPLYNEEEHIQIFFEQSEEALKEHKGHYEYLFIDDGSTDKSWSIIQALAENHNYVHGIRFYRNMGKEAALQAGLESSTAQAVITIDADLQHPPTLMVTMLEQWKQKKNFIIEAQKNSATRVSLIHEYGATFTYKFLHLATGMDLTDKTDFKLLDRTVVDHICALPEKNRFYRGLVQWTGIPSEILYFTPPERASGESKWSIKRLISLSLDAITAHTTAPLRIITFCSILFIIFSLLLSVQTFIRYLLGNAIEGFTTVIICILLTGGIISAALGIIGEYVARIHEELKSRPSFLVKEKI